MKAEILATVASTLRRKKKTTKAISGAQASTIADLSSSMPSRRTEPTPRKSEKPQTQRLAWKTGACCGERRMVAQELQAEPRLPGSSFSSRSQPSPLLAQRHSDGF